MPYLELANEDEEEENGQPDNLMSLHLAVMSHQSLNSYCTRLLIQVGLFLAIIGWFIAGVLLLKHGSLVIYSLVAFFLAIDATVGLRTLLMTNRYE